MRRRAAWPRTPPRLSRLFEIYKRDPGWTLLRAGVTRAKPEGRLVLEAMERHGLELPMLEGIRERLAEAAEEHGEKDMAATYLASAPRQPARRS